MKRALLLLALLLVSPPAFAWGPRGHEIVAHIAAMNLAPKARATVAGLLGGEAEAMLVINANWADEVRDSRPRTAPWHYVNLDITGDMRYRPERDCAKDDCVVAQITRQEAVLRSSAVGAQKAEALKFLVHFVGDIHQPLHAADNRDRGGGKVQFRYRGQRMSLHHFWDDEVVALLGRDARTVARAIDGATPRLQKRQLAGGTPIFWAEMSGSIARSDIYPELGRAAQVTAREAATQSRIARLQLARAGYALAEKLNSIFR